MMIIDKKRIKIILGCILIAIFTFTFQVANQKESTNKIQEQTAQTTSTPVSGKTVVLDAGHGIPDERCAKFKWNNRSRNKLKNHTKNSKFARE